jgi:hypothetical protein
VRQPGLREYRVPALAQVTAVAPLELGPRDSVRRILGMQVERPPLDLRAEPAL